MLETRQLLASGEARRIRELAGLRLSDVAADIGVTGSAVYRWERGERVPQGRAAADYAVLLLAMRELVDRTCSATS
jgi:transcriptional regulator with XRE-family HTH domain